MCLPRMSQCYQLALQMDGITADQGNPEHIQSEGRRPRTQHAPASMRCAHHQRHIFPRPGSIRRSSAPETSFTLRIFPVQKSPTATSRQAKVLFAKNGAVPLSSRPSASAAAAQRGEVLQAIWHPAAQQQQRWGEFATAKERTNHS